MEQVSSEIGDFRNFSVFGGFQRFFLVPLLIPVRGLIPKSGIQEILGIRSTFLRKRWTTDLPPRKGRTLKCKCDNKMNEKQPVDRERLE